MIKNGVFSFLFALSIFISACNNSNPKQSTSIPEGNYKVEISEVIQATSYTYLLVEEFGSEYWIAVNKGDFNPGETVYYANRMSMQNFESKDLGRTFESIYFVQSISRMPIVEQENNMSGKMGSGMKSNATRPALSKIEVKVEPTKGKDAATIGELWQNKDQYSGKRISVRGKVTKINLNIMDRNWVHIQDGTGGDKNYDLTITTNEKPEVGDIVTFQGTITTDKDFGAGYTYVLLMEEAILLENL